MYIMQLWGGNAGGGLRSTAAKQSSLYSGDGAAQKNATIAGIASKIYPVHEVLFCAPGYSKVKPFGLTILPYLSATWRYEPAK
jgi:hypothetical protein